MDDDLETTQSGVEEDDIQPIVGEEIIKGLSPRDEKLNALLAQFEEGEEEEVIQDVLPKEELKAPEKQSPIYFKDDGTQVVKLKVNGNEVEKDLESAIKDFQKYESADARLREAAEARKQLEDFERRITVEAQSLEAARANALQSQSPIDQPNDDEYRALLDSIYKGDEDAIDRLKRIVRPQQQLAPQIDHAELIRQASAQASIQVTEQIKAQNFNDSVQQGKDWLYENYADDIADKDIYNFINIKSGDIAAEHPGMSPKDIIKRATIEVLSKMGRLQASQPERSQREIDKSSLPKALPKQESSRRQIVEDEEDESPQAVGARMMKYRSAIRNSHY